VKMEKERSFLCFSDNHSMGSNHKIHTQKTDIQKDRHTQKTDTILIFHSLKNSYMLIPRTYFEFRFGYVCLLGVGLLIVSLLGLGFLCWLFIYIEHSFFLLITYFFYMFDERLY
jgi:hypothetical protein